MYGVQEIESITLIPLSYFQLINTICYYYELCIVPGIVEKKGYDHFLKEKNNKKHILTTFLMADIMLSTSFAFSHGNLQQPVERASFIIYILETWNFR